jgi:Ca2+-binding EF-hand superfamily protein
MNIYYTDKNKTQQLDPSRFNKILYRTPFVKFNKEIKDIFMMIKNRGKKVDIQSISTLKIFKRIEKNLLRGLTLQEKQDNLN